MSAGPLFVVVSGPPASGKSTVAPVIARGLGLPLLAKDVIKEALFEVLGAGDVQESRRLGTAAVGVMLALAEFMPAGAVFESNFYRRRARPLLSALPGKVVEVFCRCERDVAEERYRRRASTRAAGHFDDQRQPEELWDEDISNPVAGGWPVVEVDTNGPLDAAALLGRLREFTGAQQASP